MQISIAFGCYFANAEVFAECLGDNTRQREEDTWHTVWALLSVASWHSAKRSVNRSPPLVKCRRDVTLRWRAIYRLRGHFSLPSVDLGIQQSLCLVCTQQRAPFPSQGVPYALCRVCHSVKILPSVLGTRKIRIPHSGCGYPISFSFHRKI